MKPSQAITAGPPGIAAGAEKPSNKKGGTVKGGGQKVVRRDPEKRRIQNLQAQKKYRELRHPSIPLSLYPSRVPLQLNLNLCEGDKVRKRLDDLETLAASVAQNRQTVSARGPTTEVAFQVVTPTSESYQTSTPVHALGDENSSGCSAESDRHETQAVPVAQFGSSPAGKGEPPLDLSLWDSSTFIDPSYLMRNTHGETKDVERWYDSYVECGCPVRHVKVRSKKPGSGEAAQLLSLAKISLPSGTRPSHLRVDMTCTISAILANCLHLGISEPVFCDYDSVSHFYRPGLGQGAMANGRPQPGDAVVNTVQSIFRTLKPDLRPTTEQITIFHHPCIDIFPFPTLRRNLLTGVDMVDEDDLFHDMLLGLICWAGAGIGKRDRNANTGRTSSGTPWDSRSWEAKPWFLRKYWNLLGGEDGELVQQSEWWRSMRDEDGDIWSGM